MPTSRRLHLPVPLFALGWGVALGGVLTPTPGMASSPPTDAPLHLSSWGRRGAEQAVELRPLERVGCPASLDLLLKGECTFLDAAVYPGVTEWWTPQPGGWEHGFTVESLPEGSGDLSFTLKAPGHAVHVGGDSQHLLLEGEDGQWHRYGGLVAWDARGRELPLSMEPSPDGLTLRVEVEDAIAPITVDPLLEAVGWQYSGGQAQELLGWSVASAGDFNGDGYDDAVAGATLYDHGQNNEGRVLLFLGSETGLSISPDSTVESNQAVAKMGHAVAPAGDVNGDGYDDVIAGTPLFDNGQTSEGRAWLFLGSAIGALSVAWTAEPNVANALLGTSVSGAGDVDGDGYDDVVVGAPGYGPGGSAWIYRGSATGLEASPAWALEGSVMAEGMGYGVSGGGDANGDGYGDVLVTSSGTEDGVHAGYIRLYAGGPGGPAMMEDWGADPFESWDYGTTAVACFAGDLDEDGDDEVLGGGYGLIHDFGYAMVMVYLGDPAGPGPDPDWSLNTSGLVVSPAGDMNGDRYPDIAFADMYDNSPPDAQVGMVGVVMNSAAGLLSDISYFREGDESSEMMGWALARGGDVNADGYGDLLVGAPYANTGAADAGYVRVFYGNDTVCPEPHWYQDEDGDGHGDPEVASLECALPPGFVANAADCDDTDPEIHPGVPEICFDYVDNDCDGDYDEDCGVEISPSWIAWGMTINGYFGIDLSPGGDINGDGYDELMVGEVGGQDGWDDEGRAAVYFGGASGLPALPGWEVWGGGEDVRLGERLAGGGDVNGDGYDDVLVATSEGGGAGEGEVHLYLGSAAGLGGVPDWTKYGEHPNDGLGYGLAMAGDVNGDGYDDVLIGASDFSGVVSKGGRAYLYLGSPAGLEPVAAWTYDGVASSDNLGEDVVGAGDLNGDGYGDVAVSAPDGELGGPSDEGLVYVFRGGPAGLEAEPVAILEGGERSAGLGEKLAAAGDVDEDGYPDLLVGGDGYDYAIGRYRTLARLYRGTATGVETAAAWEYRYIDTIPLTCISVAGLPDFNGDSHTDVALGISFLANGQENEGAVLLFLGTGSADLGVNPSGVMDSNEAGALHGHSLTSAGDLNGDGLTDLAAGAPYADAGLTGEGAVRVYYGDPGLCVEEVPWFADDDGDGHGDAGIWVEACLPPEGYVADATDCDDLDPLIHPGAVEICGDGIDQSCDGVVDEGCEATCSLTLQGPADGSDLTSLARIRFQGDCQGYVVQFSASADFGSASTYWFGSVPDQAGNQSYTVASTLWGTIGGEFASGGWFRVVGGVDGNTTTSEARSFFTTLPVRPPIVPTESCGVTLASPAVGAELTDSPLWDWNGECAGARLELSTGSGFPLESTLYFGPTGMGRFRISTTLWESIRGRFNSGGYWRVVGGAEDGDHASAARTFTVPL